MHTDHTHVVSTLISFSQRIGFNCHANTPVRQRLLPDDGQHVRHIMVESDDFTAGRYAARDLFHTYDG